MPIEADVHDSLSRHRRWRTLVRPRPASERVRWQWAAGRLRSAVWLRCEGDLTFDESDWGTNMKSLVFGGTGRMSVQDMPEPTPGPGQVLVRPRYCAICLTDVAAYDGWWGKPALQPDSYPAELPGLVIGHEFAGKIVDVGRGVEPWRKGDRVAIEPTVFCGTCEPCRRGLYEMCSTVNAPKQALGINSRDEQGNPLLHGAMAEYCAVPTEMLFRVPDRVSDLSGASVEVAAIQLANIRATELQLGDDVVIFGASGDRLMLAQLAAMMATNVVIVDPYPHRRQMAAKMGFEHVIDPDSEDVSDRVHQIMPAGADVTFAGIDVRDHVWEVTRWQGRASIFTGGAYTDRRPDPARMAQQKSPLYETPNLITRTPVFPIHGHEMWKGGQPRHNYDVVMGLISTGKVDLESFYDTVPYDEIDRMPEYFVNYHERFLKVALDIPPE